MTKQITEYYCDMCGKKVPWVISYRLPNMISKTVYDKYDGAIRRDIDQIVPIEADLCEGCAELVYLSINKTKDIIEGN